MIMIESFPIRFGGFVLCSALVLVSCTGKISDTEHLSRAKEYQEKGEIRESMIELKSALQINPDNIEARTLLGQLYLRIGNGVAAEKEFRRALNLGVTRDALMLPLAEALALQNKHQQLLDEIEVPANVAPTKRAKLIAIRGDAWLGLGKSDKAEKEYRRALGSDPQSTLALLGLARLALMRQDEKEARKLVDQALESSPSEPKLWRFKAGMAKGRGDLDKAEAYYTKAIEFSATNKMPDLARRALIRIDQGKYDQAREDIEELKKSAPKYYLTHYAAGLLALRQQNYDAALTELEKAVSLNDRLPRIHYYLGLAYLMQKQFTHADMELASYLALYPRSVGARIALAKTKYQLGDYETARQILDPVVSFLPENLATRELMSRIEFALGHRQEALLHLQKMLEIRPESPELHARLGREFEIVGQMKEGEESLQKALAIDPDFLPAQVALAKLYLKQKRYEEAKGLIARIKQKAPESVVAWTLEAFLAASRGNHDKAGAILSEALRNHPGDPTLSHNLAQYAVKSGDFETARSIYARVLRKHPADMNARMHLALLDVRENKLAEAKSRLLDITRQFPKALIPKLILSQVYIRVGENQQAQRLLLENLRRFPDSPPLLALLYRAQIQSKQYNAALDTARRLLETGAGDFQAHLMMARVRLLMGDVDLARESLEKAAAQRADAMPVQLLLVRLESAKGEQAQARSRLSGLLKRHPEDPFVMATLGWLESRLGKPREAIHAYEKALAKRSDSDWIIALAQSRWRAGERESSVQTLEGWLENHPDDVGARYILANLYHSLRQDEAARRQFRRILEIQPDHLMALNDLAWLLRHEDPPRALDYAAKAAAKAPGATEVLDTLAMAQLAAGQTKKAERTMEPLVRHNPTPVLQLHWARILLANNRKEEAVRVLEALAAMEDFPGRGKAKALLAQATRSP